MVEPQGGRTADVASAAAARRAPVPRDGLLDTARLIGWRAHPVIGPMARRLVRLTAGVDVPRSVVIGLDLRVHHHGIGLVIHADTRIGDRVHLFQGVTIGRGDVWRPAWTSSFERVEIGDDVWLCANAVIAGGPGVTHVGRGTVVGANALLRESTGDWELWAGNPARKVGERDPETALLPRRRPDREAAAAPPRRPATTERAR